ncbi:MAG: tetratricopeptide repeat protein, partial [Halobacteriales archaeon]|nr:tetratricopeptide repeat protein [Halobacteriales archaeon]
MSPTGRLVLVSLVLAVGLAVGLSSAQAAEPEEPIVAKEPSVLIGLPAPATFPSAVRSKLAPAWDRVADLAEGHSSEKGGATLLGAALGRLGMLYHAYERDAAALTCFQRAADLDPEQPRWPYYAGYVQERAGELPAAVESFERALELDPGAPWTILRLADADLAR